MIVAERNNTAGQFQGDLLRRLRLQSHLSQEELAARVGLTQRKISLLENGKVGDLHVSELVRLAQVFGIPPFALISETRREPLTRTLVQEITTSMDGIRELLARMQIEEEETGDHP